MMARPRGVRLLMMGKSARLAFCVAIRDNSQIKICDAGGLVPTPRQACFNFPPAPQTLIETGERMPKRPRIRCRGTAKAEPRAGALLGICYRHAPCAGDSSPVGLARGDPSPPARFLPRPPNFLRGKRAAKSKPSRRSTNTAARVCPRLGSFIFHAAAPESKHQIETKKRGGFLFMKTTRREL